MGGEEEYELQQSTAQHIMTASGVNEGEEAHERSSATKGGGKYSGRALRGHWNNTCTAYTNDYCNGADHTHYRGDGGYGYYNNDGFHTGVGPNYYGNNSCGDNVHEANNGNGNYNSNGYYTGVGPENYGNDSCGYEVHEANDGYGNDNSEGEYAYANIDNYNDGSCGYTDQYGCYDDDYGGNYCKSEYGGDYNGDVGAETDAYETNDPPTEENEMCGITETTRDMATRLKRRQMRIAKLEEGIENMEKGVNKLVRSLAKLNKISPKTARAIEDELTERDEMAGILECPVEQQSIMKRLANNRFAALSEEDDEEHGGGPTMTDMCATNRHAAIKYDDILAKGTRRTNDDDDSIGTTHSAETRKRSNVIPGRAMTRGEAWNVIKERNWVQQTIADRDKRWCPTCMNKQMSPAERVGAKEYLARLMDSKNELTWACAGSGCTATICIPGTPLKNL